MLCVGRRTISRVIQFGAVDQAGTFVKRLQNMPDHGGGGGLAMRAGDGDARQRVEPGGEPVVQLGPEAAAPTLPRGEEGVFQDAYVYLGYVFGNRQRDRFRSFLKWAMKETRNNRMESAIKYFVRTEYKDEIEAKVKEAEARTRAEAQAKVKEAGDCARLVYGQVGSGGNSRTQRGFYGRGTRYQKRRRAVRQSAELSIAIQKTYGWACACRVKRIL